MLPPYDKYIYKGNISFFFMWNINWRVFVKNYLSATRQVFQEEKKTAYVFKVVQIDKKEVYLQKSLYVPPLSCKRKSMINSFR